MLCLVLLVFLKLVVVVSLYYLIAEAIISVVVRLRGTLLVSRIGPDIVILVLSLTALVGAIIFGVWWIQAGLLEVM